MQVLLYLANVTCYITTIWDTYFEVVPIVALSYYTVYYIPFHLWPIRSSFLDVHQD